MLTEFRKPQDTHDTEIYQELSYQTQPSLHALISRVSVLCFSASVSRAQLLKSHPVDSKQKNQKKMKKIIISISIIIIFLNGFIYKTKIKVNLVR